MNRSNQSLVLSPTKPKPLKGMWFRIATLLCNCYNSGFNVHWCTYYLRQIFSGSNWRTWASAADSYIIQLPDEDL